MPEETETQQLDSKKGKLLLEAARKSIAEKIGLPYGPKVETASEVDDPALKSLRGTFVTLKINDQLRGCIGNLAPEKPVLEGVKENAVNAAFHDPRFAPLSKKEFEKIQIEVSLLTKPMPLEYKDSEDLINRLRPHVDGVIIQKGPYSSTFLPQVWEQLPEKKAFLQQLCMKAGLTANAWQKGDLKVLTYQVQYFEEPR